MAKTGDTIYLLNENNELKCIPRKPYDKEDVLQELVEKYPDLLAGDQMGGDEDIRFLLVKREAGVPDGQDAPDRWSIDHVLLDQYGVPTLVEVKRSTNTQIRREIVGQLLEYAANIGAYWPFEKLRSYADEQYGGADALNDRLTQLLNIDPEADLAEVIENYWAAVKDNLKNGRLRLLFVADELPKELRTIIEFLNGKTVKDIEVLGIELRYYPGESLRAIVPRVIGQTEAITREKRIKTAGVKPITREQLLEACPPETRAYVVNSLDEAAMRGLSVYWGIKGFSLGVTIMGKRYAIFYCYPSGTTFSSNPYIDGYLGHPLRNNDLGKQFAEKMLSVPGVRKRGDYTFRLSLEAGTVESAWKALNVVFDAADKLIMTTDSEPQKTSL